VGVMSCNVYAEDFAASARFYGEVVGLRRSGDMGPDACFFEIAGRPHAVFLEGGYRRAPPHESDSRASFTLDVRSAFELHARLAEAGVTFLQEAPQDMGNATFWFQF